MRLLLSFMALSLVGVVHAQTFPPLPSRGDVYDSAKLISPEDRNAIETLSRDFRHDTGAPIVVATFLSLESVGATSIERYSTALFDRWRIGRNDANGGILLVVAKADRKVRIELGKDWRHDYDAGAKRINVETILPAFRKGDFSRGIRRGVEALAHLSERPETSATSTDPALISERSNDSGIGPLIGGLCCIGFPILFIVLAFKSIASRPRRARYQNRWGGDNASSPNAYTDPRDDSNDFLTGAMFGQAMSDSSNDFGRSFDSGSSSDGGSSYDSGGSSDSSSDSGSSGGGGDTGSW